jgi:hypothetical protein
MPDTSQEMLVVAKHIATSLELIAMQLAQLNERMAGTPGNEIGVNILNEVSTKTRAS